MGTNAVLRMPAPHSPQQNTGISGLFAMLRRHSTWLLGLSFAALVASVTTAFLWPDTFQATALVRYQSTDTASAFEKSLNDRMQAVLVRRDLKTIIERYDLFSNDVKRLPLEDVVENMRRQIHFGRISRRDSSLAQAATFPLSFDYTDRFKAQKVTQDLALLVKNASSATPPPNTGLPSRDLIEAIRKELDATETKITEFKEKNAGSLPEQAASNQDMMSSLRTGLVKLQSQIVEATRDHANLQTTLAVELEKRRAIKTTIDVPEIAKVDNPKIAAYDAQMQALEEQIKTLKVQYTDNFPDVKQARQKLDKIRADRDALARDDSKATPAVRQRTDTDAVRAAEVKDAEIKRLQMLAEAKTQEGERLGKEALEIDKQVRALEAKLAGGTGLEKQYAELLKDRDLQKARLDEEEIRYQAALQGLTTALASTRQSSAEVAEPAALPVAPIAPNRAFIIGAGSLIGVLLGLIAAGFGEMHDRRIHHLYGVSAIELRESQRLSQTSVLARWALAIVAGLAIMGVAVFHYYGTKI